MALTKNKKNEVIGEVAELLSGSKMTVVSAYQGTTVKALQGLRKSAKSTGTTVKVVKNRLVVQALKANAQLKDVDTTELKGMLLYAFNPEDEVAAAQTLDKFAANEPSLKFVGAISADGKFLSASEVTVLAKMPSKNQLIASVVATLMSPVNDVTNALSGNIHGLLDAVALKAK